MGTTPQYTKDAINRYNSKFDRIAVNLPKGTKERIKELTGKSCNAYISELVLENLDRLESVETAQKSQPTSKQIEEPDICIKSRDEILAGLTPEQRQKDEENRKRVLQQLADIEFGRQQRATKTE